MRASLYNMYICIPIDAYIHMYIYIYSHIHTYIHGPGRPDLPQVRDSGAHVQGRLLRGWSRLRDLGIQFDSDLSGVVGAVVVKPKESNTGIWP